MNLDESQNKDEEPSPVDAQNGQAPIRSTSFQFQLGSLMLVITLICVILGLGRYELALGIIAFVIFALCLVLTSKAVFRREKEGISDSESNTTWIFLCSFAYISTILALLGSIIGPIVSIVSIVRSQFGFEDAVKFPIHPALFLLIQIAIGLACWCAFFWMRRIWRRAIGKEKDDMRTDSPEVNQ